MNFVEIVGAFLSGLIAVAALSLIVAPQSTFGTAINGLGLAVANDIKAAKSG